MNRLQQTLETQRTRRASTILYGYHTVVNDNTIESYSTTNVIATTDASSWYIHALVNKINNGESGQNNVFNNQSIADTQGIYVGWREHVGDMYIFHYNTDNAVIALQTLSPITGICSMLYTYNGSTNHYRMYINGTLLSQRFGTEGVFGKATNSPMQLLKNKNNSAIRVRDSSIFSVSVGNSSPTAEQILDMHQRTFRERVAVKLTDSDHQWNLATYPTAPATLPDNTTGTASDMTLQGSAPPNRQFRWNYGKYN